MKRLAYLLVALLGLALALPAGAQQYYVGAVGGLNSADMDLVYATGEDQVTASRTVLGIGGIFGLRLNKNVCLELQPLYLQKGGTDKADQVNPDIEWKYSFLEVPTFAKVTFGQEIRPYVMAGPTFGFLLSAEAEGEVGGVVSGQALRTYKADLKDVTKSLDFGLGFGAGLIVPIGANIVFVDGRYTLGLVNILQGGTIKWKLGEDVIEGQVSEGAELSTRGFQIMVGAAFPIGEQQQLKGGENVVQVSRIIRACDHHPHFYLDTSTSTTPASSDRIRDASSNFS